MTEKPLTYRIPADLSTSAPHNPNERTEEGRAYHGHPGGLHPQSVRVRDSGTFNTPSASPTGIPFLPPKAVPWVVFVVGVAGVAAGVLPDHTWGDKIAEWIVWGGALIGIASPGLRRR